MKVVKCAYLYSIVLHDGLNAVLGADAFCLPAWGGRRRGGSIREREGVVQCGYLHSIVLHNGLDAVLSAVPQRHGTAVVSMLLTPGNSLSWSDELEAVMLGAPPMHYDDCRLVGQLDELAHQHLIALLLHRRLNPKPAYRVIRCT